MARRSEMSFECRKAYDIGHRTGYNKGYLAGKRKIEEQKQADGYVKRGHWILKGFEWYCSECNTKHEQKHDDFCCKCGAKMNNEEAE